MNDTPERNVTWNDAQNAGNEFRGKPFPCPVCGIALLLKSSCRKKPYCTCNDCGIQIFFRGKTGIARLRKLVESELAVELEFPGASLAVGLFNRLQQLKQQRGAYARKRGLIFRDPALEDVIATIEADIEKVQLALEKAKEEAEDQ